MLDLFSAKLLAWFQMLTGVQCIHWGLICDPAYFNAVQTAGFEVGQPALKRAGPTHDHWNVIRPTLKPAGWTALKPAGTGWTVETGWDRVNGFKTGWVDGFKTHWMASKPAGTGWTDLNLAGTGWTGLNLAGTGWTASKLAGWVDGFEAHWWAPTRL